MTGRCRCWAWRSGCCRPRRGTHDRLARPARRSDCPFAPPSLCPNLLWSPPPAFQPALPPAIPAAAPVCALAPAPVPAHVRTFLAFDFGLKRVGVASGNRLLLRATPQSTIAAVGAARWAQVAQRIGQWQPDALVIGVPLHPDGASHENTALALRF